MTMSKGLRLSEKWFNRGLWLIAFIFASFLIGLGNALIHDLPQVQHDYRLEDFLPQPQANNLRRAIEENNNLRAELTDKSSRAQLTLTTFSNDYSSAYQTFSNWLSTRHATADASEDTELKERTRALDALKAREREAKSELEGLSRQSYEAEQAYQKLQKSYNELETVANEAYQAKLHHQELMVFLSRLILTLPLLGIAAWLFIKKRKTPYWPFVWGFIFFALFAFFVELVPYLPSYGGYVRSLVGIVLTVLIGRQLIVSLNRYLEQQKQIEQQPELKRREELSYDTALARLAKSACPGCERSIDLKDSHQDFCPHCGISLHNYCRGCESRKNAFAKFCHHCGLISEQASHE